MRYYWYCTVPYGTYRTVPMVLLWSRMTCTGWRPADLVPRPLCTVPPTHSATDARPSVPPPTPTPQALFRRRLPGPEEGRKHGAVCACVRGVARGGMREAEAARRAEAHGRRGGVFTAKLSIERVSKPRR
jgi:hypothetical protein